MYEVFLSFSLELDDTEPGAMCTISLESARKTPEYHWRSHLGVFLTDFKLVFGKVKLLSEQNIRKSKYSDLSKFHSIYNFSAYHI